MTLYSAALVSALMLLVPAGLRAQGSPGDAKPTMLSVPPAPLLPESFGPWHASISSAEPSTAAGPDLGDKLTAEEKEYGLKRNQTADYTRSDGKSGTLTLTAEEMQDSTGAFSAFTLKRSAKMSACAQRDTIGVNCATGDGGLLFWIGDTVVHAVTKTGSVSASSLHDLLQTLPKPAGAKGALPLLPGTLPREGLNVDSIAYAVGPATYERLGLSIPTNLIDFAKSPEVITAKYGGANRGNRLTVIFYPTPTIAGDRMRAIETSMKGSKGFATNRSGPLVAIADGGTDIQQSQKLVNKVHYNATVSWNHPEGYISEVVKTASVMVKILAFVFAMTIAALVLGIFFGGARALTRKLQGKPLSSLGDDDVIKLDLRGPAMTSIRTYDKPGE